MHSYPQTPSEKIRGQHVATVGNWWQRFRYKNHVVNTWQYVALPRAEWWQLVAKVPRQKHVMNTWQYVALPRAEWWQLVDISILEKSAFERCMTR